MDPFTLGRAHGRNHRSFVLLFVIIVSAIIWATLVPGAALVMDEYWGVVVWTSVSVIGCSGFGCQFWFLLVHLVYALLVAVGTVAVATRIHDR
ncbi:hypothetical protein [Halovivax gelatinilyticus]|uniref:hypothetical protein n=1 Tax=Halovivax gelatinilyticus TaxID=2961597 RepID=UPI0020CA4E93|nr:hypothetical protein [Halovivax gelatinilyticus]